MGPTVLKTDRRSVMWWRTLLMVSMAGDILEPDYNMENNPLYEMRILSNEGHSHKTQTPAPVPVYETVDSVAL